VNISEKSSSLTFSEMLADHDFRAVGASYYGLADQIFDTKKAFADPVVVPHGPKGEPDFRGADRKFLLPPTGTMPGSDDEARRWCLLVEGFEECHPDTALLVWIEPDTNHFYLRQIAGRDEDFVQAKAVIAHALDIEPVTQPRVPADMDLRVPPYADRTPSPAITAAPTSTLPVIDPTTWHGQPVPPRAWFLPGLIPARNVTLLSGDGGLGKSLLALQLGVASALGQSTIGLTPEPGRVFYVGAEDEADEFQRRLADILRHHGASFADLPNFRLAALADRDALLASPDRGGVMQPTPLFGALVQEIVRFEPRFIVLDTCADLFGGDEIKRTQVRQFVTMLRAVAIECDCAILLLAHPSVAGMQTGTGTSGSTAWNNSVRSRLYLDTPPVEKGEIADPDARRLTTKKSNYSARGDDIVFRWHGGMFVGGGDSAREAVSGLLNGEADKAFVAGLSKINRQGQKPSPNNRASAYAPKAVHSQPEAKGFSVAQLERAMQRCLDAGTVQIIEEGPPSKLRQRLVVAADEIDNCGLQTGGFQVASRSSRFPLSH